MRYRRRIILLGITAGVGIIAGLVAIPRPSVPKVYTQIERAPVISPDYTDTVIPPNIAPLNHVIREAGRSYLVRVYAENGRAILVASRTGNVEIPLKEWRRLLSLNRGGQLCFDVYMKDSQTGWRKFQTITNTIADDPIDSHLVYRLMYPIQTFWSDIGIYQRQLTSFQRTLLLHGDSFEDGCINCHSFVGNRPDRMILGLRSAKYGSATLLADDGRVAKLGTKWGYTAWHPSGKLAAYSLNKVRQFFHTNQLENRDVVDLDSAIVYYDLEARQAKTAPALSDKSRLESYPTWTPDGKTLYFSSAPVLWADRDSLPPKDYDKVRYDLQRIDYDIDTDQWGRPETVLSAEQTGLSILLPRVSPDGQFLAFCMCEYGCFPIYQVSSDIYLMNLATGQYDKLAINSDYAESWHSWSSNSRWLVFSSKRRDGLFTRSYFAYIDKTGKASKPFILPQKDPTYYDALVKTYSVPELVTGPVPYNNRSLGQAARSADQIAIDIPLTGATPEAKGPAPAYQDRE